MYLGLLLCTHTLTHQHTHTHTHTLAESDAVSLVSEGSGSSGCTADTTEEDVQ